jgi:hypothetical protein
VHFVYLNQRRFDSQSDVSLIDLVTQHKFGDVNLNNRI